MSKRIYIYGNTYDRFDGAVRFAAELDEEDILHLFDTKAVNEERYEDMLEDADDYFVTSLIMEDNEAEESIRRNTPFSIFAEEYEFGVGYTEDEAKLAFLKGEEEMSGV